MQCLKMSRLKKWPTNSAKPHCKATQTSRAGGNTSSAEMRSDLMVLDVSTVKPGGTQVSPTFWFDSPLMSIKPDILTLKLDSLLSF